LQSEPSGCRVYVSRHSAFLADSASASSRLSRCHDRQPANRIWRELLCNIY
jgi:hypothetical protein